MANLGSYNFAFLASLEPRAESCGALAERHLYQDPNASLMKLRLLGEVLAQQTATHCNLGLVPRESQADLIYRLKQRGIIGDEIGDLFRKLRQAGNEAGHQGSGSFSDALAQLKNARELALWFYRFRSKDAAFQPPPFVLPPNPEQTTKALQQQAEQLKQELLLERQRREDTEHRAKQEQAARLAWEETASALEDEKIKAEQEKRRAEEENALWERLAEETEQKCQALKQQLETQQAEVLPPSEIEARVKRAIDANQFWNSEAETRRRIDEQLRAAGWEADSLSLRYAKGARPQPKRNLAIAEWPVSGGFADYVLFVGLQAVAIVEAKRANTAIASTLSQTERYSESFLVQGQETLPGGPWGRFKLPFVFATNGRPFLRQLKEESGIWFRDLRDPRNQARALESWFTPSGLCSLLEQNISAANQLLQTEPHNDLELRSYQWKAIQAIEDGLQDPGRRSFLLAMATGTGKTRTCLGLVYRLLKTNRFRRILFLVDRTSLGEQTENVFRELRLSSQNTLSEIFGVKGTKDLDIDPDTRFHVATIQGIINRLRKAEPPPPDQYDCIIVDECHRGYLLDRHMSETELSFRDEADYISQYTRALDHFDAVKIGLTATPALHTTQLFGEPIFTYGYLEAVRDGFLVPHGPPMRIETNLSTQGIQWRKGDEVSVLHAGQLDLVHLDDDISFDIDAFNKSVVTRPFNEAVCAELAKHIDPSLPGKTILFCATDQHADLVVNVLREALQKHYEEIENDAVIKITGSIDNPTAAIRRFRNERNPVFAVTVDLLSTGVDVPSVSNIVFLRRVRSRILYEQMLGRATRLCPEIEKESFQIFDAVRLYEALNGLSQMNVSYHVHFSTEQLVAELRNLPPENTSARALVAEQLLARLTRRFSLLAENEAVCLRATGKTSAELQRDLQTLSPEEIADHLATHPVLLRLLDRIPSTPEPQLISEHPDAVLSVSRDYHGKNAPDYLNEFAAFLAEKNQVPALLAVKTKPHDLTRAELRSLREMLDEKGFTETLLQSAQREAKNEDIAASIVGFIRSYALGDPLKPYAERVDSALQRLLQQHPSLSEVQRKWLRHIASAIKSGAVVEISDLNAGEFKKQAGGLQRLDKIFEGRLQSQFQELRALIWS